MHDRTLMYVFGDSYEVVQEKTISVMNNANNLPLPRNIIKNIQAKIKRDIHMCALHDDEYSFSFLLCREVIPF